MKSLKNARLKMIPIESKWSDLGTWKSVWSSLLNKTDGNTKCKEIECHSDK